MASAKASEAHLLAMRRAPSAGIWLRPLALISRTRARRLEGIEPKLRSRS